MAGRSTRRKSPPNPSEFRKRLCNFCGRPCVPHAVNQRPDGRWVAICARCWIGRVKGKRLNYSSEY